MPSNAQLPTVTMEDMRLIFRNFEGKATQYNNKGDRNFAVILGEDIAQSMLADGWNVKRLKPREDDEEPEETPYLPVAVNFDKGKPPRIVMLSSKGRTNLGPDEVEVLDWVSIDKVDLIVRPYHWEVNGKGGIKAYLQTMFVTIEEDELERKYAEMDQEP